MSNINPVNLSPAQQRKLTLARLRMVMKLPYFGQFVMGVDMVPTRDIKEARTDGRRIVFNPDWLFKPEHDRDDIMKVLAEGTLHMSFKHPLRRNHRDPKLWDRACNLAINPILKEEGFKMKSSDAIESRFRDKTAEQIYDTLVREQPPQPKGGSGKQQQQQQKGQQPPPPGGGGQQGKNPQGNKPPQQGQGKRPPPQMNPDGDNGGDVGMSDPTNAQGDGPADENDMAMLENSIDGKVASATQAAKAQGKMPSGLERMVVEAMKPKVDWRDRLRKAVSKTIPSDFTWMRPSRRALSHGIYMPSSVKTGCGKIVVVVDTSGSIGNEELSQFWGEIVNIFEDCQPEELHVMYCDAAVAGHDVFRFGETPVCKPRGGGGTSFKPPFRKVEKDNINPQALIYLTDGYGDFPDKEPQYPSIWVCTSEVVAPFGETIPIRI